MPTRANIRHHALLTYPIDELSIGLAPNKTGRELELAVYAYGKAEIAYDRDGDWEVVGLSISGHKSGEHRSGSWLSDAAELPRDHALYPIIVEALHSASYQDIDDQVADALAKERECV